MKWSNRLRERASEEWDSPLVWWVTQADANRAIQTERKRAVAQLRAAVMTHLQAPTIRSAQKLARQLNSLTP